MKPINFINSVPLTQQRALRRWLLWSLLLLLVTIVGLGILGGWQYYLIYEARIVRNNYFQQQVLYDQLQNQLQGLQEKQRIVLSKNKFFSEVNSGIHLFGQMPLMMRIFDEHGCHLISWIMNEECMVLTIAASAYEKLVSVMNSIPRNDYIKDVVIEQVRVDEKNKRVYGTINIILAYGTNK